MREMCSLYSNMLAAVIPQLQQVSINVQSVLDPVVSDTFYDFSTFSNSIASSDFKYFEITKSFPEHY